MLAVVGVVIALKSYLPVVVQLVVQKGVTLKKIQGRINILALGIGGGRHEGPNLSDTVIFASVDPEKKDITFISLPRDMWAPDLQAKINTAYAYGEEKKKGSGLILAKAVVSKIVGQPIDYGIRVDFNGFIKAVDLIGGIDVVVPNTFDDFAYPISGKEEDPCGHSGEEIASLSAQLATESAKEPEAFPCRYKHIHFDKGTRHMDGETALEFVRSRHAFGIEGSDFARSKRQQAVISAFKNKIFSISTFFDPGKIIGLYNILAESIDTDIKPDEFDDFIRLGSSMKQAKITSGVLDLGNAENNYNGLLMNPPVTKEDFGGAWVLIPKTGANEYPEIHNYVACELKLKNCILPTPAITPVIKKFN